MALIHTDGLQDTEFVDQMLAINNRLAHGGLSVTDVVIASGIAELFHGVLCVAYDQDGHFLWTSESFAAMTGIDGALHRTTRPPADERAGCPEINASAGLTPCHAGEHSLIGMHMTELFPPAWCRERLDLVQQVIRTGEPVAIMEIFRGRHIEATIFPAGRDSAVPMAVYIGRCGIALAPPEATSSASTVLPPPRFLIEADWGPLATRSRRQLEVLRLIAKGLDNMQIARAIFRTKRAVEWHVKLLYQALRCSDRVELFRIGFQAGLQDIPDAAWNRLMDRVDETHTRRQAIAGNFPPDHEFSPN